MDTKLIYCFDVDNTICTPTDGDYEKAKPLPHMVIQINKLYEEGHYIKISTARGMTRSGKDAWTELTKEQLRTWGVKYHELIMGKPSADLYVDDKGISPQLFSETFAPTVFTNGCFDILHAGHIKLLKEADTYGNVIVGINSDDSVRKLKGDTRPINTLDDRMLVLSSIRYVWDLIPFTQETPERLIRSLKPDVLVKGADYKEEDIVGAEYVKSYGGKVVRVELLPDHSSSDILRRLS